jgi:hypothetical protein
VVLHSSVHPVSPIPTPTPTLRTAEPATVADPARRGGVIQEKAHLPTRRYLPSSLAPTFPRLSRAKEYSGSSKRPASGSTVFDWESVSRGHRVEISLGDSKGLDPHKRSAAMRTQTQHTYAHRTPWHSIRTPHGAQKRGVETVAAAAHAAARRARPQRGIGGRTGGGWKGLTPVRAKPPGRAFLPSLAARTSTRQCRCTWARRCARP